MVSAITCLNHCGISICQGKTCSQGELVFSSWTEGSVAVLVKNILGQEIQKTLKPLEQMGIGAVA